MIKPLVTMFFLLQLLSPAQGAEASAIREEIDHLINYLAQSGCTYLRNGSEYDSAEAVEHITRKYRYFHDEIDSAETFIKYSATKSTLTGQHYSIRCPGEPERSSSAWLLHELQHYRDGGTR